MDEQLIRLMVEWWMRTPVPDTLTDEEASFADIRALLDLLRANGYAVVKLPAIGP